MKAFLNAVRADLKRCCAEDGLSLLGTLGILLREVGLQATLVYRFGRLLLSCRSQVLAWPLLPLGWLAYALAAALVRRCYGIHLALSAEIGKGFWIGHFGGIEVTNCQIGERCSVGQQTKVGRFTDRGGPQIGDGVWMGAHARIAGPIQIDDGVTIAPGARVARDIPRNSLVVGNPGRVVFRNYRNAQILPQAPAKPSAKRSLQRRTAA